MIAFACKPDLKKEGLKSPFFTNEQWDSYRRFQQQPRMFAHGFATDEETAAFLDFQTKHDQLVIGVRRHLPQVLDDFVAFETDYQYLRLGRTRQFLAKFFAYVQTLTTPGCWTGFEESYYRPDPGMNARASMADKFWPKEIGKLNTKLNAYEGLHGTIVVPMMVKQMFCFDEPGKNGVWLAAGVSTHWLKDGQPLAAKRLGSRYGLIDLSLTWKAADKTLVAEIVPQPGRTVTEVRLRLRAPGMKTLQSATLADGTVCELRGDLAILRNLTKPTTVTAQFVE